MIRLRVRDDKDKLRIAQAPRQSLRVSQPQPLKISQTIGPQNSRSLAMEQNRLWKSGQITPEQYKSRIGAIYAGELVPQSKEILQPTTNRQGIGQFTQPIIGSLASGYTKGLSNLATFTGNALEAAGAEGVGNSINQWARGQSQGIDDFLRASQFDPSPRPGENRFAVNLGSGAGSLLTSLSMRNPNAAGGLFGLQAGADQIRGARDAGVSPGRALAIGAGAGIVEGGLEKIGLDRLLKTGGSPVSSFIQGAITEGLQEFSQSLSQSAISDLYKDVDYSDAVTQALIEGGYGALLGGGTGVMISGVNTLTSDPNLRQNIKRNVQRKASQIKQNTDPKILRANVKKATKKYQAAKNKRIDLEEYGGTPAQIKAAKRAETQAENDMMKARRKLKINTTLGQSITPVDNDADGDNIRLNARADRPGTQPGNIRLSQNQDNPLDSLRQEARKYKSAEEFVRSQNIDENFDKDDRFSVGLDVPDGRLPNGFTIRKQHYDVVGRENMMGIEVFDQNQNRVGKLDFGMTDSDIDIKMIEVDPSARRKGIATTMLDKLQEAYPDAKIKPGMSTDDGTKLLENYDFTKRRKQLTDLYNEATQPTKGEGTLNKKPINRPAEAESARIKMDNAFKEINDEAAKSGTVNAKKWREANKLADEYWKTRDSLEPTKGATGQEESIRLRPQQTAIGIKQSQQAPPGGIGLSQDQSQTPLLESRSLKLLPAGSIQLSPAQAKQRFGAMSKRGQTFEVLNQIRSGTRPIYVTPGGKARVGKDFSVPVQQRGGEKIIRVDRNPVDVDVNPNNLRDISGFEAYMKDFNRIMEKVFTAGSSQFKQVDTEIIKPLESAKGDYIRFQQDKLNDLQKTIVDGLGIKKGSPESAAVQLYGEGQITEQQLINQFGEQRANDIQEADQYFRAQYDELIETVNATRRKIYGNNPDKLIQKRKDYYRHFRDLNQGFSGLRNIFAQVSDIPPELAGTSEFTKPKSKFLSIAQRRLGIETDIDAVGGYLNYIPSAAYATYIDPQIDRLRKFKQDLVGELTGRRDKIQTLRDQMKQAIEGAEWETYDDLKTQLDSLTENGKYDDTVVNNFLGFLDDYTNDLAGKTNPADRFPQKVIGRKAFQVIDWMNKRVKANVILGNASSSIAQFFNMPQGIAQAGIKNSYKGAVRSFKTIGKPDSPMKKSNFITERYFDSYNQFDTKLFDKSRNFAAWMVQVGDEVGTKFIWNSMYEQALEQNMNEDQAIRFADNQTRKMVAGRGVGEVPLLQKSRVFQMAAPFQLEVQNLWYVLGDQVSKKEFGKLVTFAVSVHLMNSAAEAIRGSDVAFDPIEALLEAFGAFDDEEDKKVGALLAAGRLGGEVLSNVPLGQQLASIYPEYGVDIGDETVTREELFGDADPTRFGTGFGGGTLIGRGIQDPLFRLIPPFGGQQIKRSLDATQTLNRGYSETPSGRVRFPVDDGVRNRLQGTVFGQYALPEAQQYFDSGNSALGENQSEDFRNQPRDQRQQFYDDIMLNRERKRNETDEEKKARKEATKQLEQERTTYSANQDSPSLFNKYGLPPVPLNDDIANAYARLQEKVNDGEVTDVSLPSAERKIVKDAYLSQLEPTVREFWSLGDDDMRKAIVSGLITKEDMDDVIALDNALFKAGILKYPQVGKTLRGELGYGLADGTQAKSSSRGGRSGGGRSIKVSSLAPKGSVTTANDIRIAFDKVTPKSTRTSVPGDPSRIIRIARG